MRAAKPVMEKMYRDSKKPGVPPRLLAVCQLFRLLETVFETSRRHVYAIDISRLIVLY